MFLFFTFMALHISANDNETEAEMSNGKNMTETVVKKSDVEDTNTQERKNSTEFGDNNQSEDTNCNTFRVAT